MARLPCPGHVTWIGVRPARRASVVSVPVVMALQGRGLEGDRAAARAGTRRQVTLLQSEHLAVVASILGRDAVDPGDLRRNIAVRGVNLIALHDRRFRIGAAVFEGTGYCHPCSRMEEVLGEGGYNAVRGHGGITARVVTNGEIRVGDLVVAAPD